MLAAESVNGIQGEGVISTIKHYSLNCNETNRHWLDTVIDPWLIVESDLLAFEIAIERSRPGSVMTGYNKVNGEYAGGNRVLIEDILKGAWRYQGWVMSDWGATRNWEFAVAGLDQESGAQLDAMIWGKGRPLRRHSGRPTRTANCPESASPTWCVASCAPSTPWAPTLGGRRRRSIWPGHNEIALETARQGIVLLKNDGVLPLAPGHGQDRRYRRVRPCGGPHRDRVQGGNSSRRICRRHTHWRSGVYGSRARPLPFSLIASRGAEGANPQRPNRVRPRG